MDRGAWFPDCRHLASSFPATTIATLATGAWPAQHGIVAGSWYDRSAKKPVPASSEALLATTLAAQVAANLQNHVHVVSLDAWQANLFAGTSTANRYWMGESGAFETLGEIPDWLETYNAQNPIDKAHNARWQALGAKPDAPALRTLNYFPERPREFMALYRSSKFAQDAQFDFASELIARERLGTSGSFDFLCLLLGSTSLLGYETGAGTVLMQQLLLNADRRIEMLLALLAKTCGDNGFDLVLAGGHGVPVAPSAETRSRMVVNGETVAQAIEQYLNATGQGHVQQYVYPFVYLDSSGYRDPEPLRQAAATAALQHPAVAGYYTAGGATSTHTGWERRFANSFHPVRSGDVMLSYHPEYVEEYGPGRGVSYGSLYNYDVQVPLCFFGPQFRAGVYERPVDSVDVAPTLARAMGVAAPSSSGGRVLGEALA